MNCPECKRPPIVIPDAAHVFSKKTKKLKRVAGFFCEWCMLAWTVEK